MLAIECPDHGSQVMVPETRIRGLHNTAGGILLDIECWCGTRIALRTGRRAAPHDPLNCAGTGLSPRSKTPVAPQVS